MKPEKAPKLTAALSKKLTSQIDTWRSDLVSLDRRQKLVYFKHTRSASLEVVSPSPAALYAALKDPLQVASDQEPPAGRNPVLVGDKTPAEVATACRRLDLISQQVYADRGFWTLYVGLGMLRWIDPADDKVAEAPIVLCPVQVRRSGSQAPFFLSRTEEDLVVNPALQLHLEKSFNLSIPALDPDAPSIDGLLDQLAISIARQPGWSIEQRTVLTTFSFHKEAIYRDLEAHGATVAAHPIVQLIALGADAPAAGSFNFGVPGSLAPLDKVYPPEDLVSILDADSSQRACIIAARDGKSFVMDGPPGTGKSQTIANIIAELMASNRTVLFVSEKAAALDVVRDRLASKGLGDFTLELHSHSATRKEVVKQLSESLTQRATARGAFTEGDKRTLQASRRELTDFANAMNEQRPAMEQSLFEVLGQLVALERHGHKPLDEPARWSTFTSDQLDAIRETAEQLASAWRPVSEGVDFGWRGLVADQHSPGKVDQIKTLTEQLADAADRLHQRSRAVDDDLGIVWPSDDVSARRRLTLLELLETRPDIPSAWLSHPDPAEIRRLVDRLAVAVAEHDAATSSLAEIVGAEAVDRVDPDACQALDMLPVRGSVVWVPDSDDDDQSLGRAHAFLEETPVRLAGIVENVRQVGAMLGIPTERVSLRRSIELGHLGALAASSALPERTWLNPAVQMALDESLRVLSSVVELVNERRTAVEQVFNAAALEADLQGLDVRFRETHRGFRAFGGAARADKRTLKSLTVSGKADKTIRARLGEAIAWQKAEAALSAAERQHAERLGSYYERTSTDFARLGEAIRTAQRAVELAGSDLNGGPMGDQLSRDGHPDPRLTVIAETMLSAATHWLDEATQLLGEGTAAELGSMPLDLAAARAGDAARTLAPALAGIRHVASVAGRPTSVATAREARVRAIALSRALVTVFDSYEADSSTLGPLYRGLQTDWTRLNAALSWLDTVRSVLAQPATDRSAERMLAPVVLAEELRERLTAWDTIRADWSQFFTPSRGAELSADVASDLPEAVGMLREMGATCVGDIGEWDAFTAGVATLTAAGLGDTLEYLAQTEAPAHDVLPSCTWAALQAWAETVISSDERLKRHRAADRDGRVSKFRALDLEHVTKAHVTVASACSARRPNSVSGTSAQLIRREAQKKTRHLPIRELLSRTAEIVQELKPCFMMSPLSVSQFLPGDMTFDAVIFDEASQVLPSDAINCIYRGGQLIVAGDEKQLPPTSFFTQAVSDDDVDEDLDLFESVLKSCKSSLPSLPLTWHYRSQHESLIMYSNYRFYAPDGQALQTFPGATFEAPDLGVESFVVNGVYRKGGARDNPVEADAVVDRLLFHRQQHPELSVGVVTFSSAQEEAISGALERRSASEPVLAGLLDDHDRLSGFFVKNLENVQGDERDIIIFSLGYGPDENGKFSMNFGPINREGGWRRLNVAITRARRRVEVVSSFRAGDMRDTTSDGLRHLRGYLDFAARGVPALALDVDGSKGDAESPFEEDVLSAISSWGYDVVTQVGSAGYRIDLGVKHPDKPGEFVLAVECDGAAYHSAAAARDRDRLRASVLQGLGWRIYRIWGISWYRDRKGESAKLRAAIEAAIAGKVTTPVVEQTDVVLEMEHIDLEAPPEWAVPYRSTAASARSIYYQLSAVESRPALQDYLGKVLKSEAPVHRDLVYRRVRDAFDVGRVGSAIKENIDFVASRLSIEGAAVDVDLAGFFRVGRLEQVRVPTDEEDIRTIGQTPPEEMDLAVTRLVADAVTIEDDDLVQAIRQLFGWRRAGGDIQAGVLAAIDRCLKAGAVERTPRGTIRIPAAR